VLHGYGLSARFSKMKPDQMACLWPLKDGMIEEPNPSRSLDYAAWALSSN
jgi:hypothetical protein